MLRFASSPHGDMHIGTLRVAILNFLVSQQKQESFTVRIDDTNAKKNIEGKDTEIMQVLEKFALTHESVFHQSEHLHMHQTLAIKLLEQGKAFVCTCSTDEIETEKEKAKANNMQYHYSGKCDGLEQSKHSALKESGKKFTIRIKKPTEDVEYHDIIQGTVITIPDEVDSFVILDEGGIPSHNFASACDDMLSGITTIVGGEEYLTDIPKQIHVKNQLGYDVETHYAHIASTENLEKEDGSVMWLFKQGFVPDAIINYLLLLGYDKVPSEVFTLPEAINWFDIKNISKEAEVFDIEKLRFINRQHLSNMDNKALSSLFGFADDDIGKLAKLYLEEVSTTTELASKVKTVFSPKNFDSKWGKEMRVMEHIIQNAPMLSKYDAFKAYIQKESGFKGKHFELPLRLLLTGEEHGPELSDIYPLTKSYILEIAS